MKKTVITIMLITISLFSLIGCGSSEPKSEADIAAEHNMSEDEMQEMKEAAARMNMSLEDHLKMMGEE